MSRYQTVDPTTGEALEAFPTLDSEAVTECAERARDAFGSWKTRPVEDRASFARQLAETLEAHAAEAASLMAREMGKPVREGRAEVEKCAWASRYYADHAPAFLADEPAETDASRSYVAYRPLGVVLAIMPWNFPFWQVIRAAVPALLAGNTVLLKHASNVPGCARMLERLFEGAGFPAGAFQNLFATDEQVGTLIAADVVRGVTLTGSVRAGRAVAEQAGRQLKPTVLELGGSDAYVILEDADIETAAQQCARSRLVNSGQSCIAAKRMIVVDAVRADFTEALVAAMGSAIVGDPSREETTVGPMARADLRDALHEQVMDSIQAGARCLLGGALPGGRGWFYPPTVLDGVAPGMRAYREELFGPVASILHAPDRHTAVEIANATTFGLGAGVFTSDVEEGERIAREDLEAGSCFVNAFVRSDPRLPFGGIGESGYGRELGREGIRAFVNAKTVWVA